MRIQAKNKLEMMDKELEVEAQKKKDKKEWEKKEGIFKEGMYTRETRW